MSGQGNCSPSCKYSSLMFHEWKVVVGSQQPDDSLLYSSRGKWVTLYVTLFVVYHWYWKVYILFQNTNYCGRRHKKNNNQTNRTRKCRLEHVFTLILTSRSNRTLLETILKTTSHSLQITHTTSTLTSTARALQSPVVYKPLVCPLFQKHYTTNITQPTMSHLRIGITTRTTTTLLNVIGTTTASSADGVSLIVSLTKRWSTLSLQ